MSSSSTVTRSRCSSWLSWIFCSIRISPITACELARELGALQLGGDLRIDPLHHHRVDARNGVVDRGAAADGLRRAGRVGRRRIALLLLDDAVDQQGDEVALVERATSSSASARASRGRSRRPGGRSRCAPCRERRCRPSTRRAPIRRRAAPLRRWPPVARRRAGVAPARMRAPRQTEMPADHRVSRSAHGSGPEGRPHCRVCRTSLLEP